MTDDGTIDIKIEPQAIGLAEETQAKLERLERELKPVDVRLAAELAKGFAERARVLAREALERVRPEVAIHPTLAKGFATQARREAEAAVKQAKTVAMPLEADLNATQLRKQMAAAQKEASKTALEATMTVDASVLTEGAIAAVREAQLAIADHPLQVRWDVDATELSILVTEAIDLAQADVRTMPIDVGFDVDPLDLSLLAIEAVEAAQADVRTMPLDVAFDLDPALLAAEARAAVVAAQASLPPLTPGTAAPGAAAATGAESTAAATVGGSALAGIAKGAAGIGVVTAGLGVGVLKLGLDFDEAFDGIRVKLGLTGDDLVKMEDLFKATAAGSRGSMEDVSLAFGTIAQRTGAADETLATITDQFVNLSRVTGTDLTSNLQNGLTALTNFGAPIEQYPDLLDQLYRASQLSGTSVSDLAADLGASGAALRAAGYDFTTSTALIANLRKEGIPAEQVMGSLGIAARKFAKDGKEPAAGLRDTIDAIKNATSSTEALQMAQGVFGRGAVGITDAIRSGRFEFQDFAAAVGMGADSISKAATDTDDFPEVLQQIRNQLTVALEPIATPLLGSISDGMTELLRTVQENMPAIESAFSGIGKAFGAALRFIMSLLPMVLPLIAALGSAVGFLADHLEDLAPILKPVIAAVAAWLAWGKVVSIVSSVAGAVSTLGSALGGVASFLLANPIVLGIAAIGAALFAAYKYIEPFREAVDKIGALIMDTLWPALQLVGQAIGALFGGDFAKAGDLLSEAGDKIVSFVSNLGPLLLDAGGALWDWIVDTVPDLLGKAWDAFIALETWLYGTAFPWLLGKLADGAVWLWGWVKESVPKAIAWLGDALSNLGDWIIDSGVPWLVEKAQQLGAALWSFLEDVGPKILPALWGFLQTIGGIILEAVPWLLDQAKNLGLAILGGIGHFAKRLIPLLWEGLQKLGGWLLGTAVPWLGEKALDLLGALLSGLGSLAEHLPGWIWDGLVALGDFILTDAIPWLLEKGADLLLWLVQGLGSLAGSLVGWAWDGFTALLAALPGLAGDVLGFFVHLPFDIIAGLLSLGSMLVDALVAAFTWLWNNLPGIASAVFDFFAGLPGQLLGFLGDLGSTLWGWATAGFDWLVTNLPGIAQGVWDFFTGLPGTIVEKIGDLGETLLSAGGDLMQGLWDGITNVAEGAVDLGKDIVNAIVGFINDNLIDNINDGIASVWEYLPGDPPQIPHIPELAAGGIVSTPTIALIGEAGPELVLPLNDPARMAELLAQAGIASDAAQSVSSSTPVTAAAIPLPDLAPVQAWADQLVAIIATIPATLEGTVPLGFRQLLIHVLDEWESLDNGMTEVLVAAANRLLRELGNVSALLVAAMKTTGEKATEGFATGLENGTGRIIAAVQGYARSLSNALNPVLSAVGAPAVQLAFASGGRVPGPRVDRDVVPAMLTPGEVVIRRREVDRWGAGALLALNEGRVPPGWLIPRRFNEGGAVASIDPAGVQRGRSYAEAAVGKPYVWGAVGPNGFDCSGLWSAIISEVRNQRPQRLFTSSSLIDSAKKIGMLPGLGQISVGAFKGNPGHVAGTIAGTNYEATPPRVRKGPGARGAADGMFTHRFHVGNGLWLEPGQRIDLPGTPKLEKLGELSRTADAFMAMTAGKSKAFVDANTFVTDTSLASLMELGTAAGGSLDDWLRQAIALAGVGQWWLPGLRTIAMRESGGNPKAINLWDSNARKGVPSKGLMQTIDPTFRAYHLAGHDDIWNPVDNAVAAIRYILARYKDIANVQQADPSRPPKGYALGGIVTDDLDRMRQLVGATAPLMGGGDQGADAASIVAAVQRLEGVLERPNQHLHLGDAPAAQSPDTFGDSLLHRLRPYLR